MGDLSGKDGSLLVGGGSNVHKSSLSDPLAAQATHFVSDTTVNSPNKFASIVYHDGSPRVLCARLVLAGDSKSPGSSSCEVKRLELWDKNGVADADFGSGNGIICNAALMDGYNIQAVTSPGCNSVTLELDGPDEYDRTERSSPFFLFGDTDGTPALRSLQSGIYILSMYDGETRKLAIDPIAFDVIDDC